MSGREVRCPACDGAGTQRTSECDNGSTVKMGVKVCTTCNGHGVVIMDGPSQIKYDYNAPKRKVVIG